jgi:predicted enzyme related to lactoylglutathione lyase
MILFINYSEGGEVMKFTDICVITSNVPEAVRFYESVFQTRAEGDSIHSYIHAPGIGIAIYNKQEAENMMGFDFTNSGTGLITIGFDVEDADMEYLRIKALKINGVTEPQLWPWGAKSFRFPDSEGNIIVFRSR